MADQQNLYAEQRRKARQRQKRRNIQNKAVAIASNYLNEHQPFDEDQMVEHYQAIDDKLTQDFQTANEYQIARQGFLKAVRDFNKQHKTQLDEPVVPVLAKRDLLTIDRDWFLEGSKVSRKWQDMQLLWQRKLKFSANDYVAYFLYSSIMFGGLNDIDALQALYQWLFTERKLHLIHISSEQRIKKHKLKSADILLLIPLKIDDDKYGCRLSKDSDELKRYINYVPDDMSLLFLYALGDVDINQRKIQSFQTIIKTLNNKLELTCRDSKKPQLSYLIKYANYHWRQLADCKIDATGSMVLQGSLKTTSLAYEKLISYNQEKLLVSDTAITWQQLFVRPLVTSNGDKTPIDYPAFSKNIIQADQDALKHTRDASSSEIDKMLTEFNQPNAMRLLS